VPAWLLRPYDILVLNPYDSVYMVGHHHELVERSAAVRNA